MMYRHIIQLAQLIVTSSLNPSQFGVFEGYPNDL